MNSKLLTRNEFRKVVFERDNHKCVICGDPAQDAHHIIDRKVWPDGGYYIDNGASLCNIHHIDAEKSRLTCEKIRKMAKIENIVLPPRLLNHIIYDKWGNPLYSIQ